MNFSCMFCKFIYFGLFGSMDMSSYDEGIIPYLHVDYISYAVGDVISENGFMMTKETNYLFLGRILILEF